MDGVTGARPLAGLRVVDITTVMLGPYATQMLGDYGADVIKVESPEGDSTRATGPSPEAGMAATFLGANRSKRSIVLDLKLAAGRDALLALLDTADVLVCSVRPQKMQALGLDGERLRARNRRLIVVGIQGFAEGGPYAGRPAYDDIIQGLCGLAALGEQVGGEPAYVPSVVADKTCALFTVQAVLMAVVARTRTGEGSHVEVPMFECMVNFTLVEHLYGAMFRPPLSEPGYVRLLAPSRKPYRTRDGHVCVVPYSTQHWERFFTEAGCPEVMQDTRFCSLAQRTRNIEALYAELARCLAERTTADWLSACERLDVPAAPVHRLAEIAHDPHLVATGFFEDLVDPKLGQIVQPRAPLRFDGACATSGIPPRLGQHTVQVLEEAGLPSETIAALLAQRAAIQHIHTERTPS